MLNAYYHKTETKVVPVTRVIEKTITPDKVTDIYKEVRGEVEKKILNTFIFNDNKVNGVVVEMEPDYAANNQKILIRFSINGIDTQEQYTRPRADLLMADAYKILVEAFAEKVFKMVAKVAQIPKVF